MRGDFCSQNTESITGTNYNDSYLTKNGASCLPNGGTGFPGSVSQDVIHRYVIGTLLPNSEALPPAENSRRYVENTAALKRSIQNEYCFYYKRYMFTLTKVLTLAATPSTNLSAGSQYDIFKQNAIRLNNLLNQIIQIINDILRVHSDSSRNQDMDMDSAHANILDHMKKLKDEDMEKNVKSAMIDYTIEKNSSSLQLLSIYGFMNIVAVGMLIYLYRSSI